MSDSPHSPTASRIRFIRICLFTIGIPRTALSDLIRFTSLFLLLVALTFVWGAARGPDTPDWWALGNANNAPNRLIRSDEVGPRLSVWLAHLGDALGGPLLPLALGMVGLVALTVEIARAPRRRETTVDVLLAAYVLACLLAYWLVAFNTYGRYLHPLLPLIGLLTGRMVAGLIRWGRRGGSRAAPTHARLALWGSMALFALIMGPGAWAARQGDSPLGSERAAYTGIADVAAYLNTLPPGTIVYDHWLGWHLGWYTGQHRPRDRWLRLTYYPTPDALAADALRQPDPLPRYFVAPDWAWAAPWLAALEEAGFAPQVAAHLGNFTIYAIMPP